MILWIRYGTLSCIYEWILIVSRLIFVCVSGSLYPEFIWKHNIHLHLLVSGICLHLRCGSGYSRWVVYIQTIKHLFHMQLCLRLVFECRQRVLLLCRTNGCWWTFNPPRSSALIWYYILSALVTFYLNVCFSISTNGITVCFVKLNRDTWANEAVSQTISTNFIFWQVSSLLCWLEQWWLIHFCILKVLFCW